jgi:hypothetical protein
MSACKSCGAKIFFALTGKGKRMPLDHLPVPDGNLVLEASRSPATDEPSVRAYNAEVDGDTTRRFVSHFSSCPAASKWRAKKREGTSGHNV